MMKKKKWKEKTNKQGKRKIGKRERFEKSVSRLLTNILVVKQRRLKNLGAASTEEESPAFTKLERVVSLVFRNHGGSSGGLQWKLRSRVRIPMLTHFFLPLLLLPRHNPWTRAFSLSIFFSVYLSLLCNLPSQHRSFSSLSYLLICF